MNWFWTVVALLLVTAGILLVEDTLIEDELQPGVFVWDLETECREDRGEEVGISLERDRSLRLEGVFPVESPRADLDYSYTQTEDRVVLDVTADVREEEPAPCLGSVVYDMQTDPLEPGRYLVEIQHKGEVVERQVILVK